MTRFSAMAGALVVTVALAGSGCGKSRSAGLDEAHLVVTVRDTMTFAPARLECRAGQRVRIQLFNSSTAANGLQHNLVVLAAGTDVDAFGRAVVEALPEDNYIPSSRREAVLASSSLVAAESSGELNFTAPERAGTYPVICTFPGHCILGMRADLVVLP